jgi:hypothetical protein
MTIDWAEEGNLFDHKKTKKNTKATKQIGKRD